jgi:hypothetical protein
VTSTGVPEDDVSRSEVWVDDGRPVGFEPVDVFVGVLEVIPTEAFLRGPQEVIVSAVSDSGPLGPGEVAIWTRLTSSNPNALISSGNNLDDPFITQSPPSFSLLGN